MSSDIRVKARKMGVRLTKNVNGRRVKRTDAEIKRSIQSLIRTRATETKRFIRICRDVLATAVNNARPAPRSMTRAVITGAAPPPPPPPPPKKPKINDKRAKLMAELKANSRFAERRRLAK